MLEESETLDIAQRPAIWFAKPFGQLMEDAERRVEPTFTAVVCRQPDHVIANPTLAQCEEIVGCRKGVFRSSAEWF
jgi:hypothetical protein